MGVPHRVRAVPIPVPIIAAGHDDGQQVGHGHQLFDSVSRYRGLGLEVQRIRDPLQSGKLEERADFILGGSLEYRSLGLEAQHLAGPAKVGLQNLPDVHA